MNKLLNKMDMLLIRGKMLLTEKKEALDQIVIMFIIIAVAAGVAGLFYTYASGTLLTEVQTKLTSKITTWFN